MPKIAIYTRKSTDDGKRQKASIQDQLSWANEYIKSIPDTEIVAVYEEKKSAKAPGRPLFNELMSQVYAGKIDTIVVWAIDRLSRNEIDEGAIKWAVREGKIKQIHTKETVYTESELFTMGIFLSMSAEEIATMRKRVMRRMDKMALEEGKVPFKAPYGYKNTGGGMVEIIPEEARILRKIFQLRVDGNSFTQIADILNREGVPTRNHAKWMVSTIEYIIKNNFYIGIVNFMGKTGEGIFERIISKDIFNKANEENRMNIGYKYHDFLLKGIVKGPDGTPLTASKIKGKYVYYHTKGWEIKISETELFRKLEKVVEKWVIPEEIMPQVEEYIKNEVLSEMKAILDEKKTYEKRLSELSKREYNIAKMFASGKISEAMFDEQNKEILTEQDICTEQIKKLSALGLADVEKFQKMFELLRNLITTYKNGDAFQKGYIIRAGMFELFVDEKKSLKIHEKEPFYWLSLIEFPRWQPH